MFFYSEDYTTNFTVMRWAAVRLAWVAVDRVGALLVADHVGTIV